MAKKGYSAEEAYRILAVMDESDGDASPAESSGSEYEPVDSSGTLTASEDDEVEVPATVRPTRPHVTVSHTPRDEPHMQQSGASADLFYGAAYTGSAAHPGPSTSTAVFPGEVASTRRAVAGTVARALTPPSQPPRSQARRPLSLPEVLANPNWQSPPSAAPVLPPFTAQSGVRMETANFRSALEFFELFFTADLYDLVVAETNRYATQYITANPESFYAQPFRWKPVTVSEFKTFLGLTLSMGITKKKCIAVILV